MCVHFVYFRVSATNKPITAEILFTVYCAFNKLEFLYCSDKLHED